MDDIGDGYKLNLKNSKISKFLNGDHKMKASNPEKEINNREEEIRDVRFMSNGLKLMVLTTEGRILLTEGLNFISSQDILNIVRSSDLGIESKYIVEEFSFERLYPVNGTVAVEFTSRHGVNLFRNVEVQK